MSVFKQLASSVFRRFGFEVRRFPPSPQSLLRHYFTMEAGLSRARARGIEIGTVIDVGASNGCWTELCLKFYPEAFFYLIEAQSLHEPALRALKQRTPRMDYVIAAAGNKCGRIYFDASDPFGGLASDTPFTNNCIEVAETTVDVEAQTKELEPPFLLKLDTHGFEKSILEGAQDTLDKTNLVIIEAYNFKVAETSIAFYQLCSYMTERGFRVIDIVDLMLRQKDLSFWQMDLFFVRSDRPEFLNNSFV